VFSISVFVSASEDLEYTLVDFRSIRKDGDFEPNNELLNANQLNLKVDNNTYIFGNFSPSDAVDWYKFNVSKGDLNGNNADRFYFSLTDESSSSGVYMELYAPLPWPHKLATSTINHKLFGGEDPALIELVAPLNGTFYLKVLSNNTPTRSQEKYVLGYGIVKEETNAAFDDDNSFDSPLVKSVDPNSETVAINEYLSAINDIQDFYVFKGFKNQTLGISLTPPVDGDFDIFLYDQKSTVHIASSENIGYGPDGEEFLNVKLQKNDFYYIRILAKVNNTLPSTNNFNSGYYNMVFDSNVPPLWKHEIRSHYFLQEDSGPLYLEPELLWMDINKFDKIGFSLWNHSTFLWEDRDDNNHIISTIDFDHIKVQLVNNGTPQFPDEAIKISTIPNKYGDTELKLGAYDKPSGAYGEHNITIHVKPVNDKPIINNTLSWEDLSENAIIEENKITIYEFSQVNIKVNAYDIEGDKLLYSAKFPDNSTPLAQVFNIDPNTGIISFYADYKYIGDYIINIIVKDNGKQPDNQETIYEIYFRISSFNIDRTPKTNLLAPLNGTVVKSLRPILVWNVSDYDTPKNEISYKLYLSNDVSKVLSLSEEALISNVHNQTLWVTSKELIDDSTYYWTAIPDDNIFTGVCIDKFYSFKTDTKIEGPSIDLIYPPNKIILNYTKLTLNWSIHPEYDSSVYSDIYFGESEKSMQLVKTTSMNTYFIDNLKNGKTYYWQIVPKAQIGSNTVEGLRSPLWRFTIQNTYKPPVVHLKSPRDGSILRNNFLTLSWELEFESEEELNYQIYLSTTNEFGSEPYSTVLRQTFLNVKDLKTSTYFWKVVPYFNEIPGFESMVWSFKIYPKVVQPVVIPKSPEDNITITTTVVELKWTIEYSGSVAKVKYDIYLDNLSNDPATMKLYKKDYRQLYIRIDLKNQETYYWRIVPTIEIEDGIVVGEFDGGIRKFTVNTFYNPTPYLKFNLTMSPTFFKVSTGESIEAFLTITNEGNKKIGFNITYSIEPDDMLNIKPETDRLVIPAGDESKIKIEIIVPDNLDNNVYVISIDCEADQLRSSKREILTIEISTDNEDIIEQSSTNGLLIFAMIIIVLVILLIIGLVKRKRRKKEPNLLEEELKEITKKEPEFENGRILTPNEATNSEGESILAAYMSMSAKNKTNKDDKTKTDSTKEMYDIDIEKTLQENIESVDLNIIDQPLDLKIQELKNGDSNNNRNNNGSNKNYNNVKAPKSHVAKPVEKI
jgi:hypothetical protein